MILEIKPLFICLLFFSCFGCNNANKVIEEPRDVIDGLEAILIRENKTNTKVTFEMNDSLEILKSASVYLGSCVNGDLALVSRGVLSGNRTSPHFNAYLNVYSRAGLKMGSYYFGSNDSLKLVDDNLIIYGNGDCDQTTQISFRDSLPKEIFVRCNEENGKVQGDIYAFLKQQ